MNAKEEFKKGWFSMIIGGFISMIVALTTVYTTSAKEDSRELTKEVRSKASKEELKEGVRAAFNYTDKVMEVHKESELQLFESIKEIVRLSSEKTEAITISIDKRLERIENKVN